MPCSLQVQPYQLDRCLHHAIIRNDLGMVRVLLAAGASASHWRCNWRLLHAHNAYLARLGWELRWAPRCLGSEACCTRISTSGSLVQACSWARHLSLSAARRPDALDVGARRFPALHEVRPDFGDAPLTLALRLQHHNIAMVRAISLTAACAALRSFRICLLCRLPLTLPPPCLVVLHCELTGPSCAATACSTWSSVQHAPPAWTPRAAQHCTMLPACAIPGSWAGCWRAISTGGVLLRVMLYQQQTVLLGNTVSGRHLTLACCSQRTCGPGSFGPCCWHQTPALPCRLWGEAGEWAIDQLDCRQYSALATAIEAE